jgi:hypothetical protein
MTPMREVVPESTAPAAVVLPTDSSTSQRPQLGLPEDARYEQALLLAMEGRFDEASGELEAFLAAHPDLNPAVERLVHAHLAYYLRKSGRISAAIRHENRMRELASTPSLPEELLEAARAAERSGDGVAMRRAHAQFLLQREQLSPSMRALIEEAWLGLGDSYRIETGTGEERSR